MRLRSISTYATRDLTLVRVESEDGQEGWGQTAPFNADITAGVLHRHIAPRALNCDIEGIDAFCERVLEAEYKFPGSYVCRALAGVETALWDLKGKREGKPVCELLGGHARPAPQQVYGSSMRRDISPSDEASRLADLQQQDGYRAFKIRVGKVCGHDEDEWPGRTEEIIPVVRRAVGDVCTLLADGNSGCGPERAIEVGRMLEQHGYAHFEEPCPYWELEQTAEVAGALEIPVAGGEQDTDLAQFRRMIRMNAVDVVQPDVCYIGGVQRTLQVAAMAAQARKPCTPHCANRSLLAVFTLHLLAAIPNAGSFMEFTIEPNEWAEAPYEPRLTVKDGRVALPAEGPGWGVRIRPAWLESAERCASRA